MNPALKCCEILAFSFCNFIIQNLFPLEKKNLSINCNCLSMTVLETVIFFLSSLQEYPHMTNCAFL